MKLFALAASAALVLAPAGVYAEDIKIQTEPEAVYSPAPASGGVAASSFDFGLDPDLVAAILAAGGVLVVAGVVYAFVQDDDGNITVSTTTTN